MVANMSKECSNSLRLDPRESFSAFELEIPETFGRYFQNEFLFSSSNQCFGVNVVVFIGFDLVCLHVDHYSGY